MSFITLSITDWPIIKQFATLMGEIMRWIYLFVSSIGINSVVACLFFFVIIAKVFLLPFSIDSQRGVFIKRFTGPEIQKLKEKYKNAPPIYASKIKNEERLINSQYYGARFSGGLVFIVRFAILVAIYGVVINLEKFIPELASSDKSIIDQLYTFLSLDLRTPASKALPLGLLIPIFVYLSSFLETLFNNISNQEPAFSVATFVSPLVTTFFAYTLPMLVGVYWGLGSLFNIIINLFIRLYYSRKPKEYFTNIALKRLNKKRTRRGLPVLDKIPIIPFDTYNDKECLDVQK